MVKPSSDTELVVSGYVKATGDTAWLAKKDWKDFCEYEYMLIEIIVEPGGITPSHQHAAFEEDSTSVASGASRKIFDRAAARAPLRIGQDARK